MIKQNEKGFTLTELLVVIFITGVISTVFLVNYRTGNKNLTLQRAAHQLAQDIRRAQSMAMAPGEMPNGEIPSSYGIYIQVGGLCSPPAPALCSQYPNRVIDEYSYIMFGDLYNNNRYLEADEYIERFDFEPGIKIKRVLIGTEEHMFLNIAFLPPDPTTKIISRRNPGAFTWGERDMVIIELRHEDLTENDTISVIVNKAGLIEIE